MHLHLDDLHVSERRLSRRFLSYTLFTCVMTAQSVQMWLSNLCILHGAIKVQGGNAVECGWAQKKRG
eukprot:1140344-Pelagomonas_calceolata.AAC.11